MGSLIGASEGRITISQNERQMNELALFAGAGGGILGGKLLGWKTVCAVELEPFRCERLAQRQNEGFLPPFPIWCGDITLFDGKPWGGVVDVVSGGFPCQDISGANPNAVGISGSRSGLWKQMLRIVCETGCTYVLVENSPMLAGRGLGIVLSDLAAVGYDARWGVLGADDIGGFHYRERMFIVGYPNRTRLQRLSGNGNSSWRPDSTGYFTETGFRFLADASSISRRAEYEQQISHGTPPWKKSYGSCEILADTDGVRKLQSERSQPNQRQRTRNGNADCLWMDREFILCQDGKIRATKPGLCGMADGVANRMDRISAVGDGQVPAVVAFAWHTLKP